MTLSRRELLAAGIGLTAASCTGQTQPDADTATTDPTASTVPGTTQPAAATSPAATQPATTSPAAVDAPPYDGPYPFVLGIASGDPDTTSVVLWTRLLSSIDETPGPNDQTVALDIATDETFATIVQSSTVDAPASYGHSVHAIADGLEPNTWYSYRFRIGDHTSPAGQTRTTPTATDAPLRFGFSSCQNWESGAYAAHRHLAETDLDLFIWLGDYIYEYGPGNSGDVATTGQRQHNSPEVDTLDGYRARYALYKSDPNLQANHAARPWILTWDDHEVDNNHAGLTSQDSQDTDAFEQRRKSAHQAWWENMPVRINPPNPNTDFPIYRTITWGTLADIHMLDGRQYRAPQPTDGETLILPGIGDLGVKLLGPTALDPNHTMLGTTQRSWLETQVNASTATWNVLGNQVYMHGLNAFPGDTPATNTDTWDGYAGERKALLETLANTTPNLIVLSGDFHASTSADLRADPYDTTTPVIATEFMAPAISSTFPDTLRDLAPLVLGINPQIRHFSPDNGYMICTVTQDTWTTELHLLSNPTANASGVALEASFIVNAGAPGIASIS